MSRVCVLYPSAKKYMHDGTINLNADTLKFALLADTYNPIPDWQATTAVTLGEYRKPTSWNMHYYKCITAGTTGGSEPTWVINGSTNADGTALWQDMGIVLPLASPHTIFADVSGSELASANGYTGGGLTVQNKIVTDEEFDADDGEFLTLGTPASVEFMWGVLYKSGTANGIVNPLIGLYLFNDTPNVGSDNYLTTTVDNGDYAIKWAAPGIIDFGPDNS